MAYRRRKTASYSPAFIIVLVLLGLGVIVSQFIPSDSHSFNILLFVFCGIVLAFGVGLLIFLSWREVKRLRALNWADIDSMSGIDFERYVGSILKAQGYNVTYTPTTGDYGTDIVAEKGADRISVQLKRYHRTVGPAAIQQAVASMIVYHCNKSMVVTNSSFTKEAKKLAGYNTCMLIDRAALADWILRFKENK